MNKQIMERINQECKKLYKRINKYCYDIPEDKRISIGDNTIISSIYINYDNYDAIPFANAYLEVADCNFDLALDVMSDEIGWQIVSILISANVTHRLYATSADMIDILNDMASYIQSASTEEIKEYFKEITNTGLFNDAIGKVIEYDKENTFVDVTEDY